MSDAGDTYLTPASDGSTPITARATGKAAKQTASRVPSPFLTDVQELSVTAIAATASQTRRRVMSPAPLLGLRPPLLLALSPAT